MGLEERLNRVFVSFCDVPASDPDKSGIHDCRNNLSFKNHN